MPENSEIVYISKQDRANLACFVVGLLNERIVLMQLRQKTNARDCIFQHRPVVLMRSKKWQALDALC